MKIWICRVTHAFCFMVQTPHLRGRNRPNRRGFWIWRNEYQEGTLQGGREVFRLPSQAPLHPPPHRNGASLLGLCPAGRHPRVTGVTEVTG